MTALKNLTSLLGGEPVHLEYTEWVEVQQPATENYPAYSTNEPVDVVKECIFHKEAVQIWNAYRAYTSVVIGNPTNIDLAAIRAKFLTLNGQAPTDIYSDPTLEYRTEVNGDDVIISDLFLAMSIIWPTDYAKHAVGLGGNDAVGVNTAIAIIASNNNDSELGDIIKYLLTYSREDLIGQLNVELFSLFITYPDKIEFYGLGAEMVYRSYSGARTVSLLHDKPTSTILLKSGSFSRLYRFDDLPEISEFFETVGLDKPLVEDLQ